MRRQVVQKGTVLYVGVQADMRLSSTNWATRKALGLTPTLARNSSAYSESPAARKRLAVIQHAPTSV